MLYKKLRSRMLEEDIDQKYLAEQLKRSYGYVNERMRGIYAFNTDEVYQICGLLKIEPQEFTVYFPKGEGQEKRR